MSSSNGLPNGWIGCSLGDLVTVIRGVSYSKEQSKLHEFKNSIPILRATNINRKLDFDDLVYVDPSCVSQEQLLRLGDIVIAASSGSKTVVGKAAQLLTDWKGSFGAFCMGLRPNQPVEPRFVAWFLQTDEYRHRVSELSAGSNINNLKREHLQTFPIRVAPLNEQRRIVAKIEELFSDLDAGVAALTRAKANLKRYRAAVLKAAVTGQLTAAWRAAQVEAASRRFPKGQTTRQDAASTYEPASKLLTRILAARRHKWEQDQLARFAAAKKTPPNNWQAKYTDPTPPDTTLPDVPSCWCSSSLGQCFEVHVGATPSRKEPKYWNGGIPWVSSGEVQFCRIKETAESITSAGLDNSSTQINPAGSVLLGMIGEGKTRGQVAILDIDACNNQNCAAIWVSTTPVQTEFVYYWLWSRYEITRSTSSGNNQPALNKARVESIPFPLPPLAEQSEIVAQVSEKLSQIEAAEATIDQALTRAARLRQSILHRAFSGLLVPQDPHDEPASAMLEPLQSGRAFHEDNGKSRQNGGKIAKKRRMK